MPDTEVAAQDNTAAAEATEQTEVATESPPAEQQASIDPAAFVLPEGFGGIDQSALNEFLPIAKELNMTQEQAQKVITMHANALSGAAKALEEKQQAAQQAGEAEVKAMFGAEYEQSMGKIQHLLKEYGGDSAVNQPIYGNKALMQTLLKIADAAGPGRFVTGKSGTTQSVGQLLFGDALKNV